MKNSYTDISLLKSMALKENKNRSIKKVSVMKQYCWICLTVALFMRLNGVSSPRI
jgi:hypothetical protein